MQFYESDRSSQISIRFINNRVKLFDLEKRLHVSELEIKGKCNLLHKWSKELYLTKGNII